MDDELTPATFAPAVGSTFTISLDGPPHTLALVLEHVTEHVAPPHAPRAQPFSLLFTGPTGGHLPQATYILRHETLGALQIFIVPVGPQPDGRHQYEAVFN